MQRNLRGRFTYERLFQLHVVVVLLLHRLQREFRVAEEARSTAFRQVEDTDGHGALLQIARVAHRNANLDPIAPKDITPIVTLMRVRQDTHVANHVHCRCPGWTPHVLDVTESVHGFIVVQVYRGSCQRLASLGVHHFGHEEHALSQPRTGDRSDPSHKQATVIHSVSALLTSSTLVYPLLGALSLFML